jgi:hypothetical protein
MKKLSRGFLSTVHAVSKQIEEYIHKAVPAVSQSPGIRRFRLLGEQLLPYHYLRPIPVHVVEKRK